jgi:NAD(P)-dependent dehydrogenase (short-subunit alcohol dehydrogenase family)
VQQIQLRHAGKVAALQLNVCDGAAIKAAVAQIVQDFGQIDIWVNNAGAYLSAAALEISDEDWDHLLNLNLRALFICAREVAKRMIDAGQSGVIINLASTAAVKTGGGNAAHYVSSKHAVAGLTKSLAFEFGHHNIRVLAVAPTLCYTPGVAEKRSWLDSFGMGSVLDDYAAKLSLGRAALPDDVARIVLFCASDLAAFMTGSMLFADGGDMVG